MPDISVTVYVSGEKNICIIPRLHTWAVLGTIYLDDVTLDLTSPVIIITFEDAVGSFVMAFSKTLQSWYWVRKNRPH